MTTAEKQGKLYCHVRFSTQTIGPVKLPPFPYTCVEVGFDTVTYVAVMPVPPGDTAHEDAINLVRTYWRDAKVFRVIRNQHGMYEEHVTNVARMGYVDHVPFARVFRWFRRGGKA